MGSETGIFIYKKLLLKIKFRDSNQHLSKNKI